MRSKKHIPIIIIFFICYGSLFALNTGKISGKVTDKQTGEPLFGANIYLVETNLGAASESDGFFYIIGIPPGRYEVKISYMGYKAMTVKGVLVNVDLTTKLDVEMDQEIVEGETITIFAERKMVQKDITSTR